MDAASPRRSAAATNERNAIAVTCAHRAAEFPYRHGSRPVGERGRRHIPGAEALVQAPAWKGGARTLAAGQGLATLRHSRDAPLGVRILANRRHHVAVEHTRFQEGQEDTRAESSHTPSHKTPTGAAAILHVTHRAGPRAERRNFILPTALLDLLSIK